MQNTSRSHPEHHAPQLNPPTGNSLSGRRVSGTHVSAAEEAGIGGSVVAVGRRRLDKVSHLLHRRVHHLVPLRRVTADKQDGNEHRSSLLSTAVCTVLFAEVMILSAITVPAVKNE